MSDNVYIVDKSSCLKYIILRILRTKNKNEGLINFFVTKKNVNMKHDRMDDTVFWKNTWILQMSESL